MNGRFLGLVLFAAVAIVPTGTAATNVKSTAKVDSDCSVTGSTLAFGSYNPLAPNPLDVSSGGLTVACTRGASSVTISLDNGLYHKKATGSMTRAMANAGQTAYLSYDIYTDSSYTVVWNSTNQVSYAPTSMAPTIFTLYGQIAAGQDVGSGTYSDTVTATVHF